jgi:hypothetical protein
MVKKLNEAGKYDWFVCEMAELQKAGCSTALSESGEPRAKFSQGWVYVQLETEMVDLIGVTYTS